MTEGSRARLRRAPGHFSLRRRAPVLHQSEAAECGLACLAMIAGHHGKWVNVQALRQRFGVSSRGSTVETLSQTASEMGFGMRALSLEMHELSQLTLPCILHWDFNHFVVLVQAGRRRAIIHDPASGRRTLTLQELGAHFTGVACELWPGVNFTRTRHVVRLKLQDLLRQMRGFRAAFTRLFLLSLLVESIALLLPVGTQVVMDTVIPQRDSSLLHVICFGLLLLTILQSAVALWRHWTIAMINALTDLQWKDGLFRHLLTLPAAWFERRRPGDIQSRYHALDALRHSVIHDISGALIAGVTAAGALGLLIIYGGGLTGIAVGFTLLYIVMRLLTWPIYRELSEAQLINAARADSWLMETLFGIATIRAQGLGRQRQSQMMGLNADTLHAGLRLDKFDMLFSLFSTFVGACDAILLLWLGVGQVLENQMTMGAWVAFNTLRALFAASALALTDALLSLRMLSLHCERVSDIALSPGAAAGRPHIRWPQALGLRVSGITFAWDKHSAPLFRDFSLSVAPGESVAIAGPSGCGKSTLMKLLSGQIAPDTGQIFIAEHDIYRCDPGGLPTVIACILQEDRLLHGSLRDNICGFRRPVDEEWLTACARSANVHDEIMRLPMGYDTPVGALGDGLSGGQKQRIFIARALYRRPGILFMDEATSHLDETNERLINQAIAGLNITRIIIAHRPSTLASAQRVITLPAPGTL